MQIERARAMLTVLLAVVIGTFGSSSNPARPPGAAASDDVSARMSAAAWPTPGFQWPLWPPPTSRPGARLFVTPTWPPPAPFAADSVQVHPVWPPDHVTLGDASPGDEPLPSFGERVWVDELPRLLYGPPPRWPEGIFQESMSATVIVQTLVDTHGRVRATRVVTSAPPFDATAEDAVRLFRFAPARRNGLPVAVWVAVPIRYRRQ
jgi:TonB family protein